MSDDSSSNSSCSCNPCGCIGALAIGTIIVGSFAVGGLKPAWYKLESLWNYDNKLEVVQKAHDVDKDGVLSVKENLQMYKNLNCPTINDSTVSQVKIPYENLVNYVKQHNQN